MIKSRKTQTGIMTGLTAYIIWGFLPVYWKNLGVVPSPELLAWRVFGAGVFAWMVILIRGQSLNRAVCSIRVFPGLILAALLIGCNWGIFLWAISAGKIVETSLGYYINPLVNVILGMIFFSERLGRTRYIAFALASCAVIVMSLDSGVFPWLSLVLATTFGLYGLVLKHLPAEIDSIEALAWEMTLLSPVATGYLVFLMIHGSFHLTGFGPVVTTMLVFAGCVTLLPLWLFSIGIRLIPLGTMGFLQYTAPTIMLLLGVLVYGETFGLFRAIAFILVALALALYSTTLADR